MSTHRNIVLKGDPLTKEGTANATITPGMLIEQMSTGNLRAHATEGGNVIPAFAIEDSMQGNDIDDDYSSGDEVIYVVPRRGDEIYALIEGGSDIAIGDLLESAGDGALQEHTPAVESSNYTGTDYNNPIVGRALEAFTDSADGRARIEIL